MNTYFLVIVGDNNKVVRVLSEQETYAGALKGFGAEYDRFNQPGQRLEIEKIPTYSDLYINRMARLDSGQ